MAGGSYRERRGRVLIVDDDDGVRRLLERHFMDAGLDTACAANGAEAMSLLDAVAPDVIVLDLVMPVMDGREFYRALRKSGRVTPVLLLTALAGTGLDFMPDGVEALSKPFDPERVVARAAMLSGARAGGLLAPADSVDDPIGGRAHG